MVLKLDLSKACVKVSWVYLRLILLHMGMNLSMVNWTMGYIHLVSFVILISVAPSKFLHASIGLRKGCPLSPFPFFLVVKGLSLLLKESRHKDDLKGFNITPLESITHLPFC